MLAFIFLSSWLIAVYYFGFGDDNYDELIVGNNYDDYEEGVDSRELLFETIELLLANTSPVVYFCYLSPSRLGFVY